MEAGERDKNKLKPHLTQNSTRTVSLPLNIHVSASKSIVPTHTHSLFHIHKAFCVGQNAVNQISPVLEPLRCVFGGIVGWLSPVVRRFMRASECFGSGSQAMCVQTKICVCLCDRGLNGE